MTSRLVSVKVADLSHSGKAFYRKFFIDSCIAKIVEALQKSKIDMRFSCCGHEEANGEIHLQDGRVLVVTSKDKIKKDESDLRFYKEHYTILVNEIDKLEKQIKKRGKAKDSPVTAHNNRKLAPVQAQSRKCRKTGTSAC